MGKPNIVFILTDHFRPDGVNENTPNLKRLCGEGVTFTNAYTASPLCQPARASIITGLLPSQHGICGNGADPLPEGYRENSFMKKLQRAGYYTALIGKHHFLDRYGLGIDLRKDAPFVKEYGVDFLLQVADDGENIHNDDDYTAYLKEKGLLEEFRVEFSRRAWDCRSHPFSAEETADGFIGEKSVEFIRKYDKVAPFYINVSFIGPHPPYWHPEGIIVNEDVVPEVLGDYTNQIDTKRGEVEYEGRDLTPHENRVHYAAKCALIDRYVGKITEELKQRGLWENTVLIFSSDHGDNCGDFGIWDKRFFFEQSSGVPLIIAGGSTASEERGFGNRVSKALVSHLDLYPTFLALADSSGEDDFSRDFSRDGVDLFSIIEGGAGNRNRPFHNVVFSELGTAVMVRDPRWKFVFDPEQGGTVSLYNMISDPREENNLAGNPLYAPVEAELIKTILSYRIRRTQYTHQKEEKRLQLVRI